MRNFSRSFGAGSGSRSGTFLAAALTAALTGDPIVRPLFFDFPQDKASYTVTDEWMLGPAVLSAPNLTSSAARDIRLPSGTWYDVTHGTKIKDPVTLKNYATPLDVTPAFVDLDAKGAGKALKALRRADTAPVGP